MKSPIEETLAMQIEVNDLPIPRREYRFHPTRRWRFDFAYPDQRIAIECEGATWANGRHNRGGGYAADLEKYNAAALLGWLVLRYTRAQVKHGTAIVQLREAIQSRSYNWCESFLAKSKALAKSAAA